MNVSKFLPPKLGGGQNNLRVAHFPPRLTFIDGPRFSEHSQSKLRIEDFVETLNDPGLTFDPNLPPMPSLVPCNLDDTLRHSCKVCGKCFRASSLLDIHMRVHVGAKPFVCTVCDHRATQKGNLKLHMRKHHGLDLPSHIDNTPDSGIWGNGVNTEPEAGKKGSHTAMLGPGVLEIIRKCQNNIGQSSMGRITESLHDFLDMANKNDPRVYFEPPPKPPKEALISCKVCNWRTSTPGYLNVHMRKHKAETHECPVCRRTFKEPWYLKNHMRAHLSEQFEAGFVGCHGNIEDKVGDSPERIGEKINFMEALGLRSLKHKTPKKSPNVGLKPYSNPAMQNLAKIGSSLRPHEFVRSPSVPSPVEDNSGGYKCIYCPKWFKYRSVLGIHARSHTGERPYKCRFCSYAGTQHNCLKLHLQRHHPSQLTPLTSLTPLTPHDGKTSPNKFAPAHCPICNRVSPSPGYLKIHMRSHKKTLDHVCPVCGRGFKEYWYLSTHLRTHDKHNTRGGFIDDYLQSDGHSQSDDCLMDFDIKQEPPALEAVGQHSDTSWSPTDNHENDNLTMQSDQRTKFPDRTHILPQQPDRLQSDSLTIKSGVKPWLLSNNKRKTIQPRSRLRPLYFKNKGQEVMRLLQGESRSHGRCRKSTPRKISKGNYLKQNDNDQTFYALLEYECPSKQTTCKDEPLDLTSKNGGWDLSKLSPHEEPLNLVIK